MKLKDITGEKFGLLTVIGRGENSKDGHVRWNCVCDCGKIKITPVSAQDLKKGAVTSCGCIHKKSISKHGYSKERLYQTWYDMIKRCENPNATNYPNYGGRGIKVCNEWHDYLIFRLWAMNNGYNDNLTLDRINNNEGYCPDNCRFADAGMQANNRRKNVYVTIDNNTHTIAEWAKISGICQSTLRLRYMRGIRGKELLYTKRLTEGNINE